MDSELDLLEKFVLAEDKSSVLSQFPSNSDFRALMTLYSKIGEKDFDQELEKNNNLSYGDKDQLQVLNYLKSLKSDPKSLQMLKKKYFKNSAYQAPQEMRDKIKSTLPSKLNPTLGIPDFFNAAKNLNEFRQLTRKGQLKVRVEDMTDEVFLNFINLGTAAMVKPGVLERVANEIANETKSNSTNWIKILTLDQLEQVEKIVPYLKFKKEFVLAKIKLQINFETMKDDEKYVELNKLYEYSKITKIPEFFSAVLVSLIHLSTKLRIFEPKFLNEYFACHRSHPIYRENNGLNESLLNEFLALLPKAPSENELLSEYFNEILPTKDTYEEVLYAIKENDAKKIFAKAKILSGADLSLFKDFLTQGELIELERKVEISLLPNNPEVFRNGDDVKLSLKIKNVKDLTVRVIEINGKNFYLNPSPTLDFDGLSATEEKVYKYNEGSHVVHIETFEFPSLNKSGIFYVELIGSGLRTVALIKRGSLKCLFKTTVAGQALTILDENNEVIKKGGVYLDNHYIDLGENSFILLPFSESSSSKSLLLTNGEFYSELSFIHLAADYKLSCGYFLNEEQLVFGNTSTVIISPKVQVHDIECDSFLISSIEASISTLDTEGQSSSKQFSRLEVQPSPLQLSFTVPPRMVSLSVSVRVTLKVNGKETVLTDKKDFSINGILKTDELVSLYVRKQENGYFLEVRGRNGEPWRNVAVRVALKSKYHSSLFYEDLTSDDFGQVWLGTLKGFENISATALTAQASVNLSQFKPSQKFPESVVLCEGDEYALPLSSRPKGELTKTAILFEIDKQSKVLRFLQDHLTFDESSSSLKFSKLEKGQYSLLLIKSSKTIRINVVDGVHFNNLDYVITENTIYKTPGQFDYFSITSTEKSESSVKVNLSGPVQNAKVYVLYSNMLPSQVFTNQLEVLHNTFPALSWNFQVGKNEFIQSKVLGDEYSYVLNRKRQAKFIGNTLPRPQLLMKRLLVSQANDEVAPLLASPAAMSSMQRMAASKLYGSASNVASVIRSSFYGDFLLKPSFWKVFPVEGSVVEVPLEEDFLNISVFVDNGTCFASTFLSFDSGLRRRDLTVLNTLDHEKSFIEKNLTQGVVTGEEFLVKNCENSFEIVDSLGKLFNLLKEIHRANCLDDWKFLADWISLSEQEKLEKIETFYSFELNFFIFHRDPVFFERVLKPFISCKLQKTLIDSYLLGESLENYAKNYENLNDFEKTLYILSSIHSESPEVRRKINAFQERAKARPTPSSLRAEVFSKIFQSSKTSEVPTIPRIVPMSDKFSGMSDLSENRSMRREIPMGGLERPGPPPPLAAPFACNALMSAPPLQAKGFGSANSSAPKLMSFNPMMRSSENQSLEMDYIPQSMIEASLSQQSYYQKMESTKKYEETGYFSKESSIFTQGNEIGFWADVLVSRVENKPILTENVLYTGKNLMSLIAALSLTDLPLVASPHNFTSEGKSIKITAQSNFMIFFKDLAEETCLNTGKIISAHSYSKKGNSKSLTSLSKQALYECKLVITNITPDNAELEALTVLPEGSIPIQPSLSMKNNIIGLPGYSTKVINYSFYFPESGNFKFIPASLSENGKVISSAVTLSPEVLDSERIDKIESFYDVVCSADDSKILEYIRENNLFTNVNLSLIYFKLYDKEFWNQLIVILEERGFFDDVVYSFCLYHEDVDRAFEYLKSNANVKRLLKDIWEEIYEESPHFEFSPLVNARAYQLGTQKRITNPEILKEYKTMLKKLVYKKQLNVADKLRICQYMLYKDELQKAKALFDTLTDQVEFSKESLKQGTLQIQLDYLRAYFYPEESLGISSLYLNYPVISWRKKFTDLYQIVTEATAAYLPDTQIQIEEHPSLSFSVENSIIKLDYSCVESCLISFYPIDLEVIFSLNPELNESSLKFSLSKPMKTVKVELEKKGKKEVKIEDELTRLNLVVEVEFAGYTKSCVVYSNDLKYLVFEQQGFAKVMDKAGRPRVGCYFKTFSKRLGGGTSFYKDGFSDIRGKFDYVSIANSDLKSIEMFMILISDDELGSVVFTAKPPPQ